MWWPGKIRSASTLRSCQRTPAEPDSRSGGLDFRSERRRRKETQQSRIQCSQWAVQSNLGRNVLNGFGTTEVDLTLRRQFRLRERLSLQARADFFNILNHPNFGSPTNYMTSPLFGQATQLLASALGTGGDSGLNPLYQIGGPRSVQLALKVLF